MEEGFQEVQVLLQLAQALVEKKGACDSTEGLLHIMQVKERNKKLCAGMEVSKEATTRSKNDLEGAYTALQNLLYEKNHFENEIVSCRGFQSKVKEEAVALMPEQDFLPSPEGQQYLREKEGRMKEHEERIKKPGQSGNGPTTKNDAIAGLTAEQTFELREGHELMKMRLAHEGKQRVELLNHLKQVKQMEASLKETVGNQEQVLHDLQGSLKNLEKTAEPMNKVLAPTTGFRGKMGKAAGLLPTPLYIIYSQLVAAREAMHINCNTSITGNVEEAQQFANAEAQEPQAFEDPYKAHPLSIEMELLRESPTPGAIAPPAANPATALKRLTCVIFEYLPALRVVTAHAALPADNNLLKAMFPEDDGSALPPEVALHLQGPSFKYSSTRVQRPYRWCQHLAGLDFVPTLPMLASHLQGPEQGQVLSGLETYRRQQRVVTFTQRLWDMKQGDLKLGSIIGNLTKNQLPTDMSMFPRPPQSLIILKEEIKEACDAAGSPPTPAKPQRKRSPVHAPPSLQGVAQQQQQQQASGEDEHMAEQAGTPEAGAPQGSPLEEDLMLDEEGAVLEGGEAGANGVGAGSNGNGHEEQQQAEAAGRSPQPGGRWKRSREASANAAAMLLLHEGEEEERHAGAAAAAAPRPKPPSRLFRILLRSQALEAEAHMRVFTDYLLRPPMIQVKALRELPAAASAAMDALMGNKGGSSSNAAKAAAAQAALPAGLSLEGPGINSMAWMEQEANIHALQLVPAARINDTLLYQMTHLRLCLDTINLQHSADMLAGQNTSALTTALQVRQQRRGRDRRPVQSLQ